VPTCTALPSAGALTLRPARDHGPQAPLLQLGRRGLHEHLDVVAQVEIESKIEAKLKQK